MFRRLVRYAQDDAFVRPIFDYLQNLGFIFLFFGAAAWKQRHPGHGWTAIWDGSVTIILGLTGAALLWLNHENLFYKLRGNSLSHFLKLVLGILYGIILVQLFRFAADGKG